MKSYTLVTDCASTMPCIVGASSSSSKVPFTEKWLGCITHQLNTVMKPSMSDEERRNTRISKDLGAVKTIVRVFKHGSWNSLLPDGFALIQEVETRFGTTFSVVERFLKSARKVIAIIERKESLAAKDALQSLQMETNRNGDVSFPALEAIITSFEPIREAQTRLEASDSPTMHLVLPMVEHIKKTLTRSASVSAIDLEGVNMHAKGFAATTLRNMQKIELHDLWVAGAVLHPRLKSLSFVSGTAAREGLKTKGYALIRKMMDMHTGVEDSDAFDESPVQTRCERRLMVSSSSGFSLEDVLDCPDLSSDDRDELSRYLGKNSSDGTADLMSDAMGVVRFWVSMERILPSLAKVAYRIYGTPVSSSASERTFSAVNRIVTPDRSRLSPALVEDIVYCRSSLKSANPIYTEEDE